MPDWDGLRRSLGEHEKQRGDEPRYKHIEEIGRGASAVVYRARDRILGRDVALKVLLEHHHASPVALARFHREVESAARLSHPNLVAVHDAGEEEGRPYMVMELVRGTTLDTGKIDPRHAAEILEKVALGLQHAHENGVVHRDLKPTNIVVAEDGTPKVADFGIAHLMGVTDLTQTGSRVGTPLYMAPEQVDGKGRPITPATDVYALGVILHELLTGTPPHTGENAMEIYRGIVADDPPLPEGDLGTVAMKAMEKDPASRYASARAFAEDLRRFLNGEPVLARPVSTAKRIQRRIRRHPAPFAAGLSILVAVLIAVSWVVATHRAVDTYQILYVEGTEAWNRLLSSNRAGADRRALENRAEACIDRFLRAAQAGPDRPEPWLMIGRCRQIQGRGLDAEQAWTTALEHDPDFNLARFERGKFYLGTYAELRLPPAALVGGRRIRFAGMEPETETEKSWRRRGVADLKKASSIDGLARSYLEGMLAYGDGDYESARRRIAAYVEENLWDAPALALLGYACYLEADFAEAERRLTAALRLTANRAWKKARGDARFCLGKFEAALEDYGEGPGRALALQALGRNEEAETIYSAVLKADPKSARAYNGRGTLRAAKLDFSGAEADFRAALLHAPAMTVAYNNLGNVLFLRGAVHEAIIEYDTAVAIDEDFAEAFANRARAHLKTGETALATADLHRTLELDPGDYESRFMLAQLLPKPEAKKEVLRVLKDAPPDWPRREEARAMLD